MSLVKLIRATNYQKNYKKKVSKAAEFIQKKILKEREPYFGIVLGSGLGDLTEKIDIISETNYKDIPNFPTPTIEGHEGKLIHGTINEIPIIGLKGRKHFYEVADKPFNTGMLQVVFPVHVLAELDVPNYFATNAAGGLNLNYEVGDLMIIRSHVSLFTPNPLLGKHYDFERLDGNKTWRFQPTSFTYDGELRMLLNRGSFRFAENIHQGVYAAVTGPTYESRAESVFLRDSVGADVVGMSTVPEAIIAVNRGMKVMGLSCITNKIGEDGTNITNHDEVKEILESVEVKKRLSTAVCNFFSEYKQSLEKQ